MPLFYTAADAGVAGMGSLLIPLVVMVALMYFMMIRPENKRKKQAEEMRNSLKKGDQITTIGGIVGKIVQVGEENIVIETSDDRVRREKGKRGQGGTRPDRRGRCQGVKSACPIE